MASTSREDLENFLQRQEPQTLVELLLELAETHEPVLERLERLQLAKQPAKLAAGFGKTLAAWKRARRHVGYRESAAYGHMLQEWLSQVERELLPMDPPAALGLFEAFIEADGAWFEQADDSDGHIGDAIREACRQWLKAAAQCETPRCEWPPRIARLYLEDEYGARDEILRSAHLLLDDAELSNLIEIFQARLQQDSVQRDEHGQLPYSTFHASGAVSLLSEALRDPDQRVRAVLTYSPNPNPRQREEFAQAYLDAGRPQDALPWLDGDWGHDEAIRQRLIAEALEALGRNAESAPIRRTIFGRTLRIDDLRAWQNALPDADRHAARDEAQTLAKACDWPITAAELLLELDDPNAAEARLVELAPHVDGRDYGRLLRLARRLVALDCHRGATVAYRALLNGILDRAYAKAYGHAAEYWRALHDIASANPKLSPLVPHEEFAEDIRKRHARKVAFWTRVREQTPDDATGDR